MTPVDMPVALKLTGQAGWNQTEADWRGFLEMDPTGCFMAEWHTMSAGVTVTCGFGAVAWIAMVLVDRSARRRGIATELMRHALGYLEGQGVQTIRLDATDAGKRVYEKLGFVPEFQLTRYAGTAPALPSHERVLEATEDMLPELAALDAGAAGIRRDRFLRRLFLESPCGTGVRKRAGKVTGFVMARPGVHALQVGPCIAAPQAGSALLESMLHRCRDRRVYMDVPTDHTAAVGVATAWGLTAQRHFTRMVRGDRPAGERDILWSSSGPEKG